MDIKIKSALISVSDKSGLDVVVKKLHEKNVKLISTGGTALFIKDMNIPVIDVSEVTKFPEMMGGRVKTLHPNIHGGLLAARDNKDHKESQDQHNIEDIDLLIVNLYPFENTVNSNAGRNECIENIDIGGPAMLRSASKNFKFVCVISDVSDYSNLINELEKNDGKTSLNFRNNCAAITFERTAHYDGVISNWFKQSDNNPKEKFIAPAILSETLRYGENPHQDASIFKNSLHSSGIPSANLIQGKDLSYNNLNDADAALQLIKEFDPAESNTVAIIKHANPCGVASGSTLLDAYNKAFACDTSSAFGGIIVLNQALDADTAKKIIEVFTEVIIAPSITDDARNIVASKKNLRLLILESIFDNSALYSFKSIEGGVLYQTHDNHKLSSLDLKVVTETQPTKNETEDMLFAFKVCKHVKSNAIVYVKNKKTIGIGAGQTSRVNSAKIAVAKNNEMKDYASKESSLKGCTVASDAFFPFPDGLLVAIESGATSVIQPGGSMNDQDVIDSANNAGITMTFTGIRHFKH
ncbi:bifunctional phosphoribosylaminoimidazolecarboxamide formyltransferase/IMP cyclohydrolase [Pelagibacteraceae bacterium]|nr:bifunctional phosphoribosylaminoimidazolecarboxamide formyltransferase/IMP cyclohydrolase [Pelagibacteraceae bacterium]